MKLQNDAILSLPFDNAITANIFEDVERSMQRKNDYSTTDIQNVIVSLQKTSVKQSRAKKSVAKQYGAVPKNSQLVIARKNLKK